MPPVGSEGGQQRRFPSGMATNGSLLHPDLGFDAHAGCEAVEIALTGAETDAHGEALNDFDVVAGGVFGWQQGVDRARAAGEGLDPAFEVFLERVDVDGDGLAGAHVGDFGFLEVCGHPDVVGLGKGEEFLAGGDLVGELHLFVADDAVFRRVDAGVLEIELGLVGLGLRGLRLGLALQKGGALNRDLAGEVCASLLELLLLCAELGLRIAHLLFGGLGGFATGADDGGLGALVGGLLVVLLAADFLFHDKQAIALFFAGGVHLLGFSLMEVGEGGLVAFFGLSDVGFGAGDVEFGFALLGGLLGGGEGDVGLLGGDGGLGLGELGDVVFLLDLVVAGVDLGEELALLYAVGVFDVDTGDEPGNAGADGVGVTIDEGVVGGFVAAEVAIEEDADDQQNHDAENDAEGGEGVLPDPVTGLLFGGWLVPSAVFALLGALFLVVAAFFAAPLFPLLFALVLLLAELIEFGAEARLLVIEETDGEIGMGFAGDGGWDLRRRRAWRVVGHVCLFPEQLRKGLFGVPHGARERDFGEVALEDGGDVVVIGLDDGLLSLDYLNGVSHAGDEAVTGLGEALVGEVDVGFRDGDLVCGGVEVNEGLADILVRLGMSVGEFGLALGEGGVGLLLIRADATAFVDGDGEGAVDVVDAGGMEAGGGAGGTKVRVDVDGGEVLGAGRFDVALRGFHAGSGGLDIGAVGLGAGEGGGFVEGGEGGEGEVVGRREGLAEREADQAGQLEFLGAGVGLQRAKTLLFGLVLNLGAVAVHAGGEAGFEAVGRLLKDSFRGGNLALGGNDAGLGADELKIAASNGQDDEIASVAGSDQAGPEAFGGGVERVQLDDVQDRLLQPNAGVVVVELGAFRDGAERDAEGTEVFAFERLGDAGIQG